MPNNIFHPQALSNNGLTTQAPFTLDELKQMSVSLMKPVHPDGEPHMLIRSQEEIQQYIQTTPAPEIHSIFGIPVVVSSFVPDDAIALVVWQREDEVMPTKIEIIKKPTPQYTATQGAAIFLVDRTLKRVLMLERATSYKGKWCLPGGKRDQSDADPVANVLRELYEETGIVLVAHDIEYLVTTTGVAGIPFDMFYHFVDLSRLDEYRVKISKESSSFSWWKFNELRRFTNKHIIPANALEMFFDEMERELGE